MNLAESYRSSGRNREAAAAFETAFARLTALGRGETTRACVLLNNWALTLHFLGQPLEAERKFRRAIEIGSADESKKGVSPMLLTNLARTLVMLHRFSEAADYADQAYSTAKNLGEQVVIAQSLGVRAAVYLEQGDLDRAEAVISEFDSRLRRTRPAGHIAFALAGSLRSTLALKRGDAQTAIVEADRVIANVEAAGRYLDYLSLYLQQRTQVNLNLRRFDAVVADAQKILSIEEPAIGPGQHSSRIGRAHLTLAHALTAQAKRDEARTAYAVALEHLEPTLGADHPETREAAVALGR
jgi:tetratricopeptide (TPR) repeat protein